MQHSPRRRQYWSLFDLIRYAVRDLYLLLLWMEHTILRSRQQEVDRHGESAFLTEAERNDANERIICILKHSRELELSSAQGACDELLTRLKGNITLGECRGQLISIRRMLRQALQERTFMYVPLNVAKFASKGQLPTPATSQLGYGKDTAYMTEDWFDQSPTVRPLGNVVFSAFQESQYDQEQIAICIVAGASTAAVFHMMRVVEWGVRKLGREVGLQKVKENHGANPGGKHKVGKIRLTPIQNCTWEKIHDQLRKKIEARLKKLRPGPAKDKKQNFYGSLLSDFSSFKEAWRNHVMHARAQYDEPEALRVLSHVERFMFLLATHAEGKKG